MNLIPSFVNLKKKQKTVYNTNPIPESSSTSINKYVIDNSNNCKKKQALTLIKVNNNPKLRGNSLILNESNSNIILSTNENFKQRNTISPKNHSKQNQKVLDAYIDKANERYKENSQEGDKSTNMFTNFLNFGDDISSKGIEDTSCCSTIYGKIKNVFQILGNNLIFNSISCLLGILGLLVYDFKILAIRPKYDLVVGIIHSLILFCFAFEIVIKIISKDHYFGGIIFLLDIASLVSIYFEKNNTLIHFSMNFYKDNFIQDIPNAKQIEIFIFITNILQIFKSSIVIKLYYFLLLIMKKIEINIKLKEILQIEDKRKDLWKKKYREKRLNSVLVTNKMRKNSFKNSLGISTKLINTLKNTNNQTYTNTTMIKNNTINNNYNTEEQTTTMVENSNNVSSPKRSNIYTPKLRRRTFENLIDSHEIAFIQLSHNNILKQKKKIEEENESQISKIVARHLSNEIIVLILFILLVFPVFKDNTFIRKQDNSSFEFICEIINDQYKMFGNFTDIFKTSIANMLTSHQHIWITNIITINHTAYTFYINETLFHKELRNNEKAYSLSQGGTTYVIYSIENLIKKISIINIIRNSVLFASLVTMSYVLVENTKENVINPLEVMINTVKCVSQDPVNFQSLEKINKSLMKSHFNLKLKHHRDTYISSEIKTIQFAVIRISSLMAIGFGEAGGHILKDNMNSFGSLNPMIPGKKINAVFGFCLIRNFRKINEMLQEKVIMFVNEIANIVHTNVNKFGGVCNKNIGESFLLIWKVLHDNNHHNNNININCINNNINNNDGIPTEDEQVLPQTREDKSPTVSKDASTTSHIICKQIKNIYSKEYLSAQNLVADCAVLSFLNIIKKITKSRSLKKLSQIPELNKLSKHGNFKIKMGFGLHIGWGIEGAIGSYYKIDCSYLSPNVNLAARLETATNIYNVDLLLSGDVFDVLSPTLQSKCRLIDCVTLKGSINPMKLYTIDVNKSIKKGKVKNAIAHGINSKDRRMKNEAKKSELFSEQKRTEMSMDKIYLERSKGLNALLKSPKNKTFLKCFTSGYNLYIKGEWEKAYYQLKQALFIDWNDGPTNSLINYIEQNNKKAPQNWKGYRNLLSKS